MDKIFMENKNIPKKDLDVIIQLEKDIKLAQIAEETYKTES
jgi:hypothetical protein